MSNNKNQQLVLILPFSIIQIIYLLKDNLILIHLESLKE